MSVRNVQNPEVLTESVQSSLEQAQETSSRLRKLHTGLLLLSIIGSALAAFIAGITAAQGPLIGDGIQGWRLACTAAAGFGFVSTISSGASQQFKISDRYSSSKECCGELKSLQLMAVTGSGTWEDVAREYNELVQKYPDFV